MVARAPRAAVESAVRQLLRAARQQPSRRSDGKQYRIDDLARAAGTTVRNVRAYRERGLLHPPARVGRVTMFDETHLARLKLITSMLERGYTSAQIAELLTAWENGDDLSDVLGLERLMRPWAADEPATMTLRQVRELAGGQVALNRLVADHLVEVKGSRAVVHRPRLLRAFAELRGYGLPIEATLDLHERLAPVLDDIARVLVEAGAEHVAAALPGRADQLTDTRIEDLVAMLVRFRTLAMDSVTATLEHAVEQRVEKLLADYFAHLAGGPAAAADAG
jgi:DNA-binding transcriptional MerR regulator